MAEVQILGLKEFQRAIARNPKLVMKEGNKAIVRGMAELSRLITSRPPWKVGDSKGRGKGVPRDTGNLKQRHVKKIKGLTGIIYPDVDDVDYAKYVHGRGYGEYNRRTGVQSRPWLDRAKEDGQSKIDELGKDLLTVLVRDLAK